jgi:hypothetical protein
MPRAPGRFRKRRLLAGIAVTLVALFSLVGLAGVLLLRALGLLAARAGYGEAPPPSPFLLAGALFALVFLGALLGAGLLLVTEECYHLYCARRALAWSRDGGVGPA